MSTSWIETCCSGQRSHIQSLLYQIFLQSKFRSPSYIPRAGNHHKAFDCCSCWAGCKTTTDPVAQPHNPTCLCSVSLILYINPCHLVFFPKHCGHTEGVLTVSVKGPVFNRGVHRGVLHFSCKFPQKNGCAGAHKTRAPERVCGICSLKFAHKNGSCEMFMCVFPVNFHTKCRARNCGPALFL